MAVGEKDSAQKNKEALLAKRRWEVDTKRLNILTQKFFSSSTEK